MKTEPVALIELVKTVINLAIVWAVVMGWWDLSDVQQATTASLAIAVVNLVGTYVQRNNVYAPDTVQRLLKGNAR